MQPNLVIKGTPQYVSRVYGFCKNLEERGCQQAYQWVKMLPQGKSSIGIPVFFRCEKLLDGLSWLTTKGTEITIGVSNGVKKDLLKFIDFKNSTNVKAHELGLAQIIRNCSTNRYSVLYADGSKELGKTAEEIRKINIERQKRI